MVNPLIVLINSTDIVLLISRLVHGRSTMRLRSLEIAHAWSIQGFFTASILSVDAALVGHACTCCRRYMYISAVFRLNFHWFDLFSPLGKLADWAVYFTFRYFFFYRSPWDQLFQNLPDRFSQFFFHQTVGISYRFRLLFLIPQGTLPWQPILGEMAKWPSFGRLTFEIGLEYASSMQKYSMAIFYLHSVQIWWRSVQ